MPIKGTKISGYWGDREYSRVAEWLHNNKLDPSPSSISTAAQTVLGTEITADKVTRNRRLKVESLLAQMDAAHATAKVEHKAISAAAEQIAAKTLQTLNPPRVPESALDLVLKSIIDERLRGSEDKVIMAVRQMLDAQYERMQDLVNLTAKQVTKDLCEAWGIEAPKSAPPVLPSAPLPVPESVAKKVETALIEPPKILFVGVPSSQHGRIAENLEKAGLHRTAKLMIVDPANIDLKKLTGSYDHVVSVRHSHAGGSPADLLKLVKDHPGKDDRKARLHIVPGGPSAGEQILQKVLLDYKIAMRKTAEQYFK